MTGTNRDYVGKQVDAEFLQTVTNPVGTLEMSLSMTLGSSRRVTGVQKAIQRYVSLLLTSSESVPFSSSMNTLLYELRMGTVSDLGYLRHLFNMANTATLDAIRKEDYNTARFGDQDPEDVIASVTLSGMSLDYDTSTVSLSLVFRTEAGSDYVYTLPVSTGQG